MSKRWATAQEYERNFWKGVADRIAKDASKQMNWYEHLADSYKSLILPRLERPTAEIRNVLEVGSGPIGIATFFGIGTCTAIDPLHDFYQSHPALAQLRNPAVRYLTGGGESLPFSDRDVDIVIIDNVLDHTSAPDRVLSEIRRVLPPRGILFFKVNVRTPVGTAIHKVLSKSRIDRGHPHSYSAKSIRRLLESYGFRIEFESVDSFKAAWTADMASRQWKDKLKGLLGVSEFWYTAVCKRGDGVT